MTGIQLFLTEDVSIAHGHTTYVHSPWALTSVSPDYDSVEQLVQYVVEREL